MQMKLKNLIRLSVLAIITFNVAYAKEGGMGSGGGFVVRCTNTPVHKGSIKMLDLYEMEEKNIPLMASTGNIEEDYFNSVDNTYTLQGSPDRAEGMRDYLYNKARRIINSIKFVSWGQLPKVNDVGVAPNIASHCGIEQIAFFNDKTDEFIVDRWLWNQLDSLNKAALIRHELAGKGGRIFGNETSTQFARALTGHYFAKTSYLASVTGGLSSDAKLHRTRNIRSMTRQGGGTSYNFNHFYFYSQRGLPRFPELPITRFQFVSWLNSRLPAKLYVDLPIALDIDLRVDFNRWDETTADQACVLQNENIDYTWELPLAGTLAAHGKVKIELKTNEPITITFMRHGKILSKTSSSCIP